MQKLNRHQHQDKPEPSETGKRRAARRRKTRAPLAPVKPKKLAPFAIILACRSGASLCLHHGKKLAFSLQPGGSPVLLKHARIAIHSGELVAACDGLLEGHSQTWIAARATGDMTLATRVHMPAARTAFFQAWRHRKRKGNSHDQPLR